jgi:hypothetical protein
MKRGLLIAAALSVIVAAAWARDYTYLEPPTLAVMDFEVSMSQTQINMIQQGIIQQNRAYYGELVSEALLSVLVQQNAASVVVAPTYVTAKGAPNYPLFRPGDPVYTPAAPIASAEPMALLKLKQEARTDQKAGQQWRYYVPPIFKIFDKKYVEAALQNNNFTTKDLYTKAATAFAFPDLDYVVLGNVYETTYRGKTGAKDADVPAIGINVRVLNTKRAEELYAYTAVVDADLHDLPAACSQICCAFMLDILNSHCAQFMVTKGTSFTSAAVTDNDEDKYKHTLFWQPQQVRQDDATLAASDHSNKREIAEDQYYWILPGQFIVSLYSEEHPQLREIPFSIANQEIKVVPYEKQHFDVQTGAVTIGGVAPTASYTVAIKPDAYHAQYWWEIFYPPQRSGSLTVSFDNGEASVEPKAKGYAAEYRPATQELVISNVAFGSYSIQVTRNAPKGMSDIDGLWLVQTKLIVVGKSVPLIVQDAKGVKMQITDFGIQERKAIEAPQTTKISFVLNPGFGMDGYIQVNDSATEPDKWLHWKDKEKITITSEYGKDDWDSQPQVTYTIWASGADPGYFQPIWASSEKTYQKTQLVPARDTVEIVDVNDLKTTATAEAKRRAALEAKKNTPSQPLEAQAAAKKTSAATKKTTTQTTAAKTSAAKTAAPKAAAGAADQRFYMNPVFSFGYGSYQYWDAYANYNYSTYTYTGEYVSSGGVDLGLGASALYFITPSLGVGAGLLMDYILGDGTSLGFAGTINVGLGDVSKGDAVFQIDVGYGSGFTAGLSTSFSTPGATLGLNYFGYNDGSWSVSMSVGFLLGLF